MPRQIQQFYEFDDFRFDPEKRILWHGAEIVPLPPKAADVLLYLLIDHGDLVGRQELIERVWNDTFVEEGNLNHAISSLRKAIGSDLIQTVPRRGYRFSGAVSQGRVTENELLIEKRTSSTTLIEEHQIGGSAEFDTRLWNGGLPGYFRHALIGTGVLVFLLATAAWFFNLPDAGVTADERAKIKSLAVLPLHRFSESENDGALSLGLTDAVISKLGGLDGVAVRPYSAVKDFGAGTDDALELGRKLKVDAVLEGSLQIVNDRLHVRVRLFRVDDGSAIWAGSFDENVTDVLAIQESLSTQVARSLTQSLTPIEQQRLTSRPTEDFEAYKLYLRGRHAWDKRTPEGLRESIRLFQAAIDRDPTFSVAYAGLADAYVLLNDYDVASPAEAYPKAKAAAGKALDIDPGLVEPRVTIAYVLATYEWKFDEAEREYRHAIEIAPNYATAHQWYGEMLYATKRFEEAEVEMKRAAELNPLAPIVASELAAIAYYAGKYDEAIDRYAKLKEEYPNFPTTYLFTAFAYEQKQMFEETVANEIIFWRLQRIEEAKLTKLERIFREEGYTAYLQEVAKMLEGMARSTGSIMEYRLVHIYARLRDRDKTLEWLEKGIIKRSSNIAKVNLDPNFEFLSEDKRFKELQGKLHGIR